MSLYTKEFLSQSSGGMPIQVGSSSATIHTTQTSSSITDEVWLYAANIVGTDVNLDVSLGGKTIFQGVIEGNAGNVLICPGLIAKGNGVSGLTIQAEAAYPPPYTPVLYSVNVFGYVNRIS